LTDLPDTIDLAFDRTALSDDERREPVAVVASRRADIAEIIRLDPARIELGSDPAPPERSMWRGPIGSFVFHLLPLLALVTWFRPPLEMPPPIPVKFVIEQPPPSPPPAPQPAPSTPKPKPPPPPGLHASEDMGEVGPPKPEKGADTEPPTKGEPQPPAPAAETKAATAAEPPLNSPKLAEAPPPPPLPPKPAPPKREAAVHLPKPDGLALPLPIYPDKTHTASASARVPGPTASRDEYCVYALSLITRHTDLVPLSLVGARRGDTVVGLRVLENGTISQVRVIKGSGYTDIDERIAQMVVVVGQLPPLPQWMPGPYQDFIFHMHFPNFVER